MIVLFTTMSYYFYSLLEKKEQLHNDLSLKTGLRKKVIKVPGDNKTIRAPNKNSVPKVMQTAVLTEKTVTNPETVANKEGSCDQKIQQVGFIKSVFLI